MSQLNPKLTPLPPYPANTDTALNWIWDNRPALESIIAAQENNNDAHPTNCACPDCEPDDGPEWRDVVDTSILKIFRRLDALESKPATSERDAWKCKQCEDTKMVHPTKSPGSSIRVPRLCSCLKVGDAVTAGVANMLPVGSQVCFNGKTHEVWELDKGGEWHWDNGVLDKWYTGPLTILRIGPAPVTTPADDICERWEKAYCHHPTEDMRDTLRRLGLPEMAAVCEAADDYIEMMAGSYQRLSDTVAALRKVKEAANGEA